MVERGETSCCVIESYLKYFVDLEIIQRTDNEFTINHDWMKGDKEIKSAFTTPFQMKDEDTMSVYWPYIINMLQTMGSLSIDRLHTLLGHY